VDGNLQKGEIQCRFSTTSHSGVMVPVYAFGPGSENFSGMYENADIFHKIVKLLNLNK
jgi:alkaline phosphatase